MLRSVVLSALALPFAIPAGAVEWTEQGNAVMIGFNGIITAPADPVASVISPPEEFEELPLAPVTGRFIGFFSGTLLCIYRLTMGVLDVLFVPLRAQMLSPEPRYIVIPDIEHTG